MYTVVAVTASSSLARGSPATLLHSLSSSPSKSAFSISRYKECASRANLSNLSAKSINFRYVGAGLRVQIACLVVLSGNRIVSEDHGKNKLAKKMIIRSFASRKDRREMDAEGQSAKFEPDIASLKTGFSKKFPGEDTSGLSYDWGSDDSDDEVKVQSFRGGSYGRAQSPTSSNSARDGHNVRTANKRGNLSRFGRPHQEVTGYERRKGQGNNNRQATGSQDSRNYRRIGAEVDGSSDRTSGGSRAESIGNNIAGAKPGEQSWIDSGEVDGARNYRSSAETRGDDSTSRRFREDDRIAGNRGPARKMSNVSSQARSGREPYGGGEWSKDTPIFEDEEKKKKKPVIEPVNFTSPMSKSPHVAILGGGMSGLVCALKLEEHGIQSTAFDTGKHGLGGRMGTRFVEEQNGSRLVFDHAAQFFTVTDPRFQNLVDGWLSQGAVRKWNGNVGTLRAGGHYSELPLATRYIGTNGMRSLADCMLSKSQQINVKRPCWISRMEAVNGRWKLTENRTPQGEFDAVVIAHNGKCANRLLSTAHVPQIARQMKRLELSSIWALLAAFEEPLPLPEGKILDGAFVDGINSLSWMGNNSSKLVLGDNQTPQCWTFFSTAGYGKRNKVPQESIPLAKASKVQHDMLRGVETALGLADNSLPTPVYTRLQLWGAALPTNTPDVPCIFDAHGRVGICGDWLAGSSLEAAAVSGMALADHIARYRDLGDQDGEEFDIGLEESFAAVEGHDIGQFPGTEEFLKESHQNVLAHA